MAQNKEFANVAIKELGNNGTKYRTWFYGSDWKGIAWCAIFVSWCASKLGVLNKIVFKTAGAGYFGKYGVPRGMGKFYKRGSVTPQSGDIITFVWNSNPVSTYAADHVGIVVAVEGNTITTVEGNANGTNDTSTVCKRTYSVTDTRITGYYRPNWETSSSTTENPTTPATSTTKTPDIIYKVKTDGRWLPEVKNLEDYAGIKGRAITDVAVKVTKGKIWYQVHVKGGAWLPKVTGYDVNDFNNGYAGNGKPIDAVRVYYTTTADVRKDMGKYLIAEYRVSPIGGNYYSWQFDNEVSVKDGMDGYAGLFGKTIDRLQISLK